MNAICILIHLFVFSFYCVSVKAEEAIPKTYRQAIESLEKTVSQEDQAEITRGEIDSIDMHFGLGMRLRNNWKLWGDSELTEYLRKRGFEHPDGMSGVILEGFCLKLRGKDFDLLSVIQAGNKSPEQSFVDFIPVGDKKDDARAGAILFREFSYGPEQTILQKSLVWHPETGKVHLKENSKWRELTTEELAVFERLTENWLFNREERLILEALRLKNPDERLKTYESMTEEQAWKFSGFFEVAESAKESKADEVDGVPEKLLTPLE